MPSTLIPDERSVKLTCDLTLTNAHRIVLARCVWSAKAARAVGRRLSPDVFVRPWARDLFRILARCRVSGRERIDAVLPAIRAAGPECLALFHECAGIPLEDLARAPKTQLLIEALTAQSGRRIPFGDTAETLLKLLGPDAPSERSDLRRDGVHHPAPASFLAESAPPSAGDLDKRVRAYLGKVGSCAEGMRSNTAFGVACWLVADMALPLETAGAYLAEWNANNAPPLSERELVQCLRSALKHARRPAGSGLHRVRDYRTLPPFGGFGKDAA